MTTALATDRPAAKERRRFPRYLLPSMYTGVEVRPLDSDKFQWQGHAYDISESGMRFEVDEPIDPGTQIAVRIDLPGSQSLAISERRPVYALADVVWVEQEDVEARGPVRMACSFKRFIIPGDRQRLRDRLGSGRFSAAA